METWRRLHHHRPNYLSGPRARFKGIVATTLLRQGLNVHRFLASPLPPDSFLRFCHHARFRLPENAIPRMLQSCTGPNFVLPHLYPHNPTYQCDRSYVLYRLAPRLSFKDMVTLNNSTRNAGDRSLAGKRPTGFQSTPPVIPGPEVGLQSVYLYPVIFKARKADVYDPPAGIRVGWVSTESHRGKHVTRPPQRLQPPQAGAHRFTTCDDQPGGLQSAPQDFSRGYGTPRANILPMFQVIATSEQLQAQRP